MSYTTPATGDTPMYIIYLIDKSESMAVECGPEMTRMALVPRESHLNFSGVARGIASPWLPSCASVGRSRSCFRHASICSMSSGG